MKNKLKKMILLLTATSVLCLAVMGCSSDPVPGQDSGLVPTGTETDKPEDMGNTETPEDKPDAETEENMKNPLAAAEPSDNGSGQSEDQNDDGKWHVLDPELAKELDADFECIVWELKEGFFYAAEVHTEILEDGSLLTGSPSSESTLDDSELFQVVYDDNTHFYVRNIYDNGDRFEDTEAGPKDLEIYSDCALKGYFEDDIFYASEIRISKVH